MASSVCLSYMVSDYRAATLKEGLTIFDLESDGPDVEAPSFETIVIVEERVRECSNCAQIGPRYIFRSLAAVADSTCRANAYSLRNCIGVYMSTQNTS